MTKTVRQVIDLLEKDGWNCIRIKGDHRIFYKEEARRPVVVPGNLNDELAVGTLKQIIREAGIL